MYQPLCCLSDVAHYHDHWHTPTPSHVLVFGWVVSSSAWRAKLSWLPRHLDSSHQRTLSISDGRSVSGCCWYMADILWSTETYLAFVFSDSSFQWCSRVHEVTSFIDSCWFSIYCCLKDWRSYVQCGFSLLSFTCRDFLGFSEVLNDALAVDDEIVPKLLSNFLTVFQCDEPLPTQFRHCLCHF